MTTPRVNRLAPDQVAWLDEVRDEWIGHALAVGPADRQVAVDGVHAVYRAAGLTPPEIMVWLGSPLAGLVGSRYLAALLNGPDHDGWDEGAGTSVADLLRDDLGDQFYGWFGSPAADQIRAGVGQQVEARVRPVLDLLDTEMTAQAGMRIADQVEECVRAQAGIGDVPWSREQIWGAPGRAEYWVYRQQLSMINVSEDAELLADLDMAGRLGMEPDGRLEGVMQVARSAGAWWPMRDGVVLTERPVELHRDSQGRAHSASGPAILYPDGWGIHAWHGTRVPASLIDDTWTTEQIMSEPNSEIRRCAVERTAATKGWRHLIDQAQWPQVGQTVPDPGNPGQALSLYRVEGIYDQPVNLLWMTNGTAERDGTRREYGETVPATITDPVAAAAWQIGISPADYRQTVRRT